MNKKPIQYRQFDDRWGDLPYGRPRLFKRPTIRSGGCAPTVAAMVIATLRDASVTPADTARWATQHGLACRGGGTHCRAYFPRQMKAAGITCWEIPSKNGKPDHDRAKQLLQEGYYVLVSLLRPCLLPRAHAVLFYDWQTLPLLCDPNGTEQAYLKADPQDFFDRIIRYWAVDARDHNRGGD